MRRRGASRVAVAALLGVNLVPADPTRAGCYRRGSSGVPGHGGGDARGRAAVRGLGGRRTPVPDVRPRRRRPGGRGARRPGRCGPDRGAGAGGGSTLADFDRGLGGVARRAPAVQAGQLYPELRATEPAARVAVLAWLGYDPPDGVLTAAGGVSARPARGWPRCCGAGRTASGGDDHAGRAQLRGVWCRWQRRTLPPRSPTWSAWWRGRRGAARRPLPGGRRFWAAGAQRLGSSGALGPTARPGLRPSPRRPGVRCPPLPGGWGGRARRLPGAGQRRAGRGGGGGAERRRGRGRPMSRDRAVDAFGRTPSAGWCWGTGWSPGWC